jgi:hypothetical protein
MVPLRHVPSDLKPASRPRLLTVESDSARFRFAEAFDEGHLAPIEHPLNLHTWKPAILPVTPSYRIKSPIESSCIISQVFGFRNNRPLLCSECRPRFGQNYHSHNQDQYQEGGRRMEVDSCHVVLSCP